MKRVGNLYSNICNLDNIITMTNKVCSRVKNKKKVDIFETYKAEHIYNIKKRLDKRDYTLGKYNIFMINDPKCRIVMAENIEDKIINHLVADNILVRVFENKYLDSMCATRIGKGTSYGIKLLKKYLNEIKKKYDNFYVLKIDIKKYFYNIDHGILKDILRKKIKDRDALNILDKIIDSTNNEYVNEEIIKLKNKRIKFLEDTNLVNKDKLIEEVKSIPTYHYGKGLALGNQTSQAFGLIYLYELNHYFKEILHLKHVINYMDDFVIIHHDKSYLKFCFNKIINKLKDYKLEINVNKSKIDSIKNGIDFLGYHFYLKNNKLILKLRNRTKKNLKYRAYKLKLLYKNKYINKQDFLKYISSYKGILKNGNCTNLSYKELGV